MATVQKAVEETAKKSAPFVSSASENGGLTLFPADSKAENGPDVNGFYTQGGERKYVSGWLIPAGKTEDGKEYGSFLSLVHSVPNGDGTYKTVARGAVRAMNNWKGEPVKEDSRSRVIGSITPEGGGEPLTVVGFATKVLADDKEAAVALGFTGPVNHKSPEAEGETDKPRANGPRP